MKCPDNGYFDNWVLKINVLKKNIFKPIGRHSNWSQQCPGFKIPFDKCKSSDPSGHAGTKHFCKSHLHSTFAGLQQLFSFWEEELSFVMKLRTG